MTFTWKDVIVVLWKSHSGAKFGLNQIYFPGDLSLLPNYIAVVKPHIARMRMAKLPNGISLGSTCGS